MTSRRTSRDDLTTGPRNGYGVPVISAALNQAAIEARALPVPAWWESNYRFIDDGPVVTDYEGKRIRVTQVTVTDFSDTTTASVSAEGHVLRADGGRDQRFGHSVAVHGPGVAEALLALHRAAAPACAIHGCPYESGPSGLFCLGCAVSSGRPAAAEVGCG